jgi:phosphoenolpyruvate phosphomutase
MEMVKMSKAAQLRSLLARPGAIVVGGAHNALSSRLVQEAGFDAVWASGLEISATFGVPDADILTMTEHLDVVRTMVRATSIPVIADCDAGYGNAINVVRTVRLYEEAGVGGICLEDNVFPKQNSFYSRDFVPLADIPEQVGKLRAVKETQRSPEFVLIARTEAFIAGHGLQAALDRANAYADAGADLCLIHSKKATPEQVYEFVRSWDRPTPLVCLPTTYPQTTVDELHDHGYKMVIFANHGLRASIKAMQTQLARLRLTGCAADIEPELVGLKEVFRLVGEQDMRAQEARYVPVPTPVGRG